MRSLVLTTPLGSEEYSSYVAIKLKMWGFGGVATVRVHVCMACPLQSWEVVGAVALPEAGTLVGL